MKQDKSDAMAKQRFDVMLVASNGRTMLEVKCWSKWRGLNASRLSLMADDDDGTRVAMTALGLRFMIKLGLITAWSWSRTMTARSRVCNKLCLAQKR
ncbi:hypothetical protein U1Q18_029658 [Sarracenia purpurea var. burkii]